MAQKNVLAFGVEPSQTKYRLRLARYPAIAEKLQSFLRNLYIRHFSGLFVRQRPQHIQTFWKRSIIARNEAKKFLQVLDTYGFRIISSGIFNFLRNHLWWYRFCRWLGALLPSFCIKIQMTVEKNTGSRQGQ